MSPHTTKLAPEPQYDVTVHIVLDDFGQSGRAYRETAEEAARAAQLRIHLTNARTIAPRCAYCGRGSTASTPPSRAL
jgi:hypothetical protein